MFFGTTADGRSWRKAVTRQRRSSATSPYDRSYAEQTFSSCLSGDLSSRLVRYGPPPLDFFHGYLHAGQILSSGDLWCH